MQDFEGQFWAVPELAIGIPQDDPYLAYHPLFKAYFENYVHF
jgi:hypothetical protein